MKMSGSEKLNWLSCQNECSKNASSSEGVIQIVCCAYKFLVLFLIFMELYGTLWNFMTLYDIIFTKKLIFDRSFAIFMPLYGTLWNFMTLYGTL